MTTNPIEPLQRLAGVTSQSQQLTSKPTIGTRNSNGAHAYGKAALDGELARLRAAKEGERNNVLNQSAFALGQLVGGGVLSEGEVWSELRSAAQAIGLERAEIESTIRSGLEAGVREPRSAPNEECAKSVRSVQSLSQNASSFTPATSTASASKGQEWIDQPGAAAYSGLAGELVELVDQHTEADPVAVLGHFLAMFGCAVGRGI
jgi:hypothetical protein